MNFTYNAETKVEKATNSYSTKIYEYNTKDADDKDWGRFSDFLQQSDYENNLEGKEKAVEETLAWFYNELEEVTEITIKWKKEFPQEESNDDEGFIEGEDQDEEKKPKNFIPRMSEI